MAGGGKVSTVSTIARNGADKLGPGSELGMRVSGSDTFLPRGMDGVEAIARVAQADA